MDSKPLIENINPRAAIAGGEIQIRGQRLCPAPEVRPHVRFGGLDAGLVVSSNNYVVARVPEGAVTCEMTVGSNGSWSDPISTEIAVPIAENMHPVANPAIDSEGNIFVTFSGPRGQKVPVSVYKIDTNYNVRPFATEIMNPTGMAFDRKGILYVSCRNDGTIYRVTPTGTVGEYAQGMGIATGIAFDEEEYLYVGDRSGTIFKIAPDRQIFVFATIEPSISAYHLAFGPEGYLYVTGPTTSSCDAIYRVSKTGEVERFFRGFGRPQGMAFDAKGNLLVAASYAGRRGILSVSPSGECELVVSGLGLVGLAFTLGPAIILVSNQSVYHLNWSVAGRALPG